MRRKAGSRKKERVRVNWTNDNPPQIRKHIGFVDSWEDSFTMTVEEFEDTLERQRQSKTSTHPFIAPSPQYPPFREQQNFNQEAPAKRRKIEDPIPDIQYVSTSQGDLLTPSEVTNLFITPDVSDAAIQPPVYWTPLPATSSLLCQDTYPISSEKKVAESMDQKGRIWWRDSDSSVFEYYFSPEIESLPSLEDIGDSAEIIEISDDEAISSLQSLTDESTHNAAGEKEAEQEKIAPKSTIKKSSHKQHSFFSSKEKGKEKVKDSPEHEETMKLMEDLGIDNMTPEDYIPTDLDKPYLVYVGKVDVLKSFGGRGLFAKQDIPADTRIGAYTGESFASKEEFDTHLSEHPDKNNKYAMDIGKKVVDAAVKGNFTRYANFSDSQENIFFQLDIVKKRKVVTLITKRAISKGEQILVNYNEHKSEISESYCFLNPEDGCNSAQELYRKSVQHYSLLQIDPKIELLKLEKGEYLYASSIGKLIFANKSLPRKITGPVDLLFLRANLQHEILDFDKADTFTPLMLACYRGQLGNVRVLIKHKANVNRQQHSSGNCPLFFALEGYAEQTSASKKRLYFKIITHLIGHGAKIHCHDRRDMTFIHKAVATLSTEDFKNLASFLHQKHRKSFTCSFNYINVDNLDHVLYCLSIKSLDKAKILLDLHPKSFKENCNRRNKEETIWYVEAFQKIIQAYDESEKEMLLDLLNSYDAPAELVNMLNATHTQQNSPAF